MGKRNILAAVLSGAILAAAMPKPGIFVASWLGLAPLLVVIRRVRPTQAAVLGFVAGVVYFGIILNWMLLFGKLPWILLAAVQAVFFAFFAAGAQRQLLGKTTWTSYLTVPALWTALQWLRSLGPYGFTWGSFAHTQAEVTSLVQVASLTGPWGIDFIVCLANTALAQMIRPVQATNRFAPAVMTAGLVAAIMLLGRWAVPESSAYNRPFKVAVIQGSLAHTVNLEPGFTLKSFELYRKLSLEAAKGSPDLIVWPETTLPEVIDESNWGPAISDLAVRTRASYLVGGYDAPKNPNEIRSYNAAHLFGSDGRRIAVYHKVHLVPYGEFVPLRDRLPFLKYYGIRAVDVLPGDSHVIMRLESGKIGVAICFESLFPQITRVETRDGAELLFVLTNDSWFQKTQAARQHLMVAQLRAVETRRYIVRAASTGISAMIDPWGRISSQLGLFEPGIIAQHVGFRSGLTPYVRFGDWFAYLCAACCLAAGLLRNRTLGSSPD